MRTLTSGPAQWRRNAGLALAAALLAGLAADCEQTAGPRGSVDDGSGNGPRYVRMVQSAGNAAERGGEERTS